MRLMQLRPARAFLAPGGVVGQSQAQCKRGSETPMGHEAGYAGGKHRAAGRKRSEGRQGMRQAGRFLPFLSAMPNVPLEPPLSRPRRCASSARNLAQSEPREEE